MKKSEINKEIGKLLGFKARGINVNGVPNADGQWIYPESWRDQIVSVPQRYLPDFLGIIESSREVLKMMALSDKVRLDYKTMPSDADLSTKGP